MHCNVMFAVVDSAAKSAADKPKKTETVKKKPVVKKPKAPPAKKVEVAELSSSRLVVATSPTEG